MKILEVLPTVFDEVKLIKFARFVDNRGYFTETYRFSQLEEVIPDLKIKQIMESHSKKWVLRGLHFQYDPPMGKLVRTVVGEMIDFFLDIRPNSKTFGKIGAVKMPSSWDDDFDTWIWVPFGFAHGNLYLEESTIEYFATATWNSSSEVGINPLSKDIDWNLVDKEILNIFKNNQEKFIISEKDKGGVNLKDWLNDERIKFIK